MPTNAGRTEACNSSVLSGSLVSLNNRDLNRQYSCLQLLAASRFPEAVTSPRWALMSQVSYCKALGDRAISIKNKYVLPRSPCGYLSCICPVETSPEPSTQFSD